MENPNLKSTFSWDLFEILTLANRLRELRTCNYFHAIMFEGWITNEGRELFDSFRRKQ